MILEIYLLIIIIIKKLSKLAWNSQKLYDFVHTLNI